MPTTPVIPNLNMAKVYVAVQTHWSYFICTQYYETVDKDAPVASYLCGEHSWNPQDWELESVDNFFELLYSNIPSRLEEDRISWTPSKVGQLDVCSYYEALRGLIGSYKIVFTYKNKMT